MELCRGSLTFAEIHMLGDLVRRSSTLWLYEHTMRNALELHRHKYPNRGIERNLKFISIS